MISSASHLAGLGGQGGSGERTRCVAPASIRSRSKPAGCRRVVAAHQDLHGPRDLRWIAADGSAMPVTDAAGMPELRGRAPRAAPNIGVPGDDPQRCLLAGAADDELE
jgi:hypothetical protein